MARRIQVHVWMFVALLIGFCPFTGHGQNVLTEMDHDAHQVYDRMIILSGGGPSNMHSSLKPYWRSDLVSLADSFWAVASSDIGRHQAQHIWDQNNEFVISSPSIQDPFTGLTHSRYRRSNKALWNTFFTTPAQAYEVDVPDFYLRINPIIHIAAGRETEEGVTSFINQRGISLRGGIGKNVFFQTSIYDSQIRFPNYINQYTDVYGVVPGVGLYKDFTSTFFDVTAGRDFLLANAYVGVSLGKYIGFQLGHNQFFIGDGIRSLLFSDFSTPFFSLKINTRIWKFQYQNIFAEIASDNFTGGLGTASPIPKKYMAAHYLSYKPTRHVSIGLFEAVVFNREDHRFELQYLNPVILYRTIEGSLGSPDNVLLGFNVRADLRRRFSVYGQFMLDDISISRILDGHLDWWGNKFAYQLGLKHINVLQIDALDLQVEWNRVRPYVYSHYDENANYSHYKQALAHPLGANFNELIFSISYAFSPRLRLKSSVYIMEKGEDADSLSYGGNVIKPNILRPGDFDHATGQGVGASIIFWNSSVTYEPSSGIYIDGRVALRKKTSDLPEFNANTSLVQVGIRYNMFIRDDVF